MSAVVKISIAFFVFFQVHDLWGQVAFDASQTEKPWSYQHPIPFAPSSYVVPKTDQAPNIDGNLKDAIWRTVRPMSSFVDIEGELKPNPAQKTEVKLLWDDDYLYLGARLHDEHIWATLKQRDTLIYLDDAFELFVDPTHDGHNYFEFEINAFNTIWDLFMMYPYEIDERQNNVSAFSMKGLRHALQVNGSLNDPSDVDRSWTIELAIPWEAFKDFGASGKSPKNGEQWRMNFMRVDWPLDVMNGKYKKSTNQRNQDLPPRLSVWSPIGTVNIHRPELWGMVQFSEGRRARFIEHKESKIQWAMWQLYYQLKECHRRGRANCSIEQLTISAPDLQDYSLKPTVIESINGFRIVSNAYQGKTYVIDHKAQMKTISH